MKSGNQSESPQETPAKHDRPAAKAKAATDFGLATLRQQVAGYKDQARVLRERFERGEISAADARKEAERLNSEVSEAERRANRPRR